MSLHASWLIHVSVECIVSPIPKMNKWSGNVLMAQLPVCVGEAPGLVPSGLSTVAHEYISVKATLQQ